MAWLTEIEKAYLAGLIDGEGSISIKKRIKGKPKRITPEYRLVITVTNTCRDVIYFILDKIKGMSGFYTKFERIRNPKRKPIFEIQLRDKTAELLLKEIFPYLIIKKKQAELGLRLRETFSEKYNRWNKIPSTIQEIRENCYQEIKRSNQRGIK